MTSRKIKSLNGCNAYVRIESSYYRTVLDLVSYSSRVARVVVEGSNSTSWYLDPAATCSGTTIKQVKRFFNLLNGQKIYGVKVELGDSAYKALKLDRVATLVNANYGPYDHSCSYSGSIWYDSLGNKLERAGADCTSISGHFEPRRAYDNGYTRINPAYIGAWRTW